MILLDAVALVALLRGEPRGRKVAELLRSPGAGLALPNLAETVDVLVRRHGADQRQLSDTLDALIDGPLALVPLGRREALRAGALRARQYHRTNRPLSLGDCFLLASTGPEDRVATADRHLIAAASAEQIAVLPLEG